MVDSPATRASLLVRLRDPQDHDAWRQFFQVYSSVVYGFARRRGLHKLLAALSQVGLQASMPGGTYFLYVRAPKSCAGRTFANAEEASQFLIQEQSVVCVPWDNAGAYLRFSATYLAADEHAEDDLMRETVDRLGKLKLQCWGAGGWDWSKRP